MVGKHIYFPPDSARCTSSAKKAAEGAVPASGHIKNPSPIFRFQVQGQFNRASRCSVTEAFVCMWQTSWKGSQQTGSFTFKMDWGKKKSNSFYMFIITPSLPPSIHATQDVTDSLSRGKALRGYSARCPEAYCDLCFFINEVQNSWTEKRLIHLVEHFLRIPTPYPEKCLPRKWTAVQTSLWHPSTEHLLWFFFSPSAMPHFTQTVLSQVRLA